MSKCVCDSAISERFYPDLILTDLQTFYQMKAAPKICRWASKMEPFVFYTHIFLTQLTWHLHVSPRNLDPSHALFILALSSSSKVNCCTKKSERSLNMSQVWCSLDVTLFLLDFFHLTQSLQIWQNKVQKE